MTQDLGTTENPRLLKMGIFIATLKDRGTVRHAAESARINPDTAYEWRKADPEFRAAWDQAIEDSTDTLEASLYERALSAPGMPGVISTIALLKARRPEQWNEKLVANRALAQALVDNPQLALLSEMLQELRAFSPTPQPQQPKPPYIEGTVRELSPLPPSSDR